MARFSGRKLTDLRGKKTQTDLANALRSRGFGTTQTQVSRWESGQEPRKYIRDAIAAELGCAVDDMYEAEDPRSMRSMVEDLQAQITALLDRVPV